MSETDIDIPKVKRNISKMIDANAPESDIDAYVKSEGVSLQQLQNPNTPEDSLGKQVYQKVVTPILQYGGAAIGGALGSELPIAGNIAMGVAGYVAGSSIAKAGSVALGYDKPETIPQAFKRVALEDVPAGVINELTGQTIGAGISAIGGKLLSPLSEETATQGAGKLLKVPNITDRQIPSSVTDTLKRAKDLNYNPLPSELAPESKTMALLEGVLGYSPFSGDVMLKRSIANLQRMNTIRHEMMDTGAPRAEIETIGKRIKDEATTIISNYSGRKGDELTGMVDKFVQRFGATGKYETGQTLGDMIKAKQIAKSGDVTTLYNQVRDMLPAKGKDIIPISNSTLQNLDNILIDEMSSAKPDREIVSYIMNLKKMANDPKLPEGVTIEMMNKFPELKAVVEEMQSGTSRPLRWNGAKLTSSRLGDRINEIYTSTGGKPTTTTNKLGVIKNAVNKDMESYAESIGGDTWQVYQSAKSASSEFHDIFPEKFLKILQKHPDEILDTVIKSGKTEMIDYVQQSVGEEGMVPLRQGFFKKILDLSSDNGVLNPKKLKKGLDKLGEDTLNKLTTTQQREALNNIIDRGQYFNIRQAGGMKTLEFLSTVSGSSNENIVNSVIKPNNTNNVRLAKRLLSSNRINEITGAVLENKILKLSGSGDYLPISSSKEWMKYQSVLKELMPADQYDALHEFMKLGINARKVEMLAKNASQTAQTLHGISILRHMIEGRIGTLTKMTGIPYLISKAYTSPTAMRWFTSAVKLPPNSPQAIAMFMKGINIIGMNELKNQDNQSQYTLENQ